MNWQEKCVSALNAENMFEDSWHRTRFKELLDCYVNYPFFTKGLCKCMYLFARDDEHFCLLLQTLSEMTIGKRKNAKEMIEIVEGIAKDRPDSEYFAYQLSVSFLENTPFEPDGHINIDSNMVSLIGQALKASEIIDSL